MTAKWRRIVYGPVCALFFHDAMGLLCSDWRLNDNASDTRQCACTHRRMTGAYIARRLGSGA